MKIKLNSPNKSGKYEVLLTCGLDDVVLGGKR